MELCISSDPNSRILCQNKNRDDAPYKPEPRVKKEEIDDDNLALLLASTPGASTSSAPQEAPAAAPIVTTARAQRATRREEIRTKAPNPTVRIKIAKSKLSKPAAARAIKIALGKVFWSFILDTTMFIWCRACKMPVAIGEGEEFVETDGDVARRLEAHDVHAGSEKHQQMHREWIARGGDKVLREKEAQMRCVEGQRTMAMDGSWLRTWKFVPVLEVRLVYARLVCPCHKLMSTMTC